MKLHNVLTSLTLAGSLCALAPQASQAAIEVRADFNSDGFDDLAIGVPSESIANKSFAGAVNVIYGTALGLSEVNNQFWFQDLPGITAEFSEPGDTFGDTLAAGDFNGDGFADLAIGALSEDLVSGGTNVANAGVVHVLYGSAAGLTDVGDQLWHQDSPGTFDVPSTNDHFGSALAAGDFNRDGFADLAIGVPGQNVGGNNGAGGVQILIGSATGLTTTGGVPFFTQNSLFVFGQSEPGDIFGTTLAAGNFNGDGFADLAIGVSGEDYAGGPFLDPIDRGEVDVVYGSATGLNSATSPTRQQWTQEVAGIEDDGEQDDRYGSTLAAGDFNGDGRDDLAVGVPQEDIGSITNAGAVNVIYGTAAAGLTEKGDQFWHQDVTGIRDNAEALDRFGDALTAGDFNGDGRDDLAVGVSFEDFPGFTTDDIFDAAGAVNVIYGTAAAGLTERGDQLWEQETQNVEDTRDDLDIFGSAVSAGDFNGDGRDDLAVGVRGEDIGGISNAGAVNVIYGTARTGLDVGGIFPGELLDQFWHQDVPGILDTAEANDSFGSALSF